MPFKSKAQQGFAFATDQPWADEFAKETDFKRLPARKKKVKAKAKPKKAAKPQKKQVRPAPAAKKRPLTNIENQFVNGY